MSLYKNVNGVDVLMTDDEEAAIRSEWAANDARAASAKPATSADAIINSPAAMTALKAALAK